MASGEKVVRSYRCTVEDGSFSFLGLVIPGRREGDTGVLTVTNRRVVFDCGESLHREIGINGLTSVSVLLSRFGRDARFPLLIIFLGLMLAVVPYLYATDTDSLHTAGDYEKGYNDAVSQGYYDTYLAELVGGGTVAIPVGTSVHSENSPSARYSEGYGEGYNIGASAASAEIASAVSSGNIAQYSDPTGLYMHSSEVEGIVWISVAGAVAMVVGALLYLLSWKTRDWVVMNFGGAGESILLSSVGRDQVSSRQMCASEDMGTIVDEIGALIVDIRSGRYEGSEVFTGSWVEHEDRLREVVTF
ncbi:MAG: hypothetical protein IJ856_06800 [Candidatus Methanomethylophilaceae archaeon]|nr:hypothetical protein [Candidatus Methanomethylophilaceae archaeon]